MRVLSALLVLSPLLGSCVRAAPAPTMERIRQSAPHGYAYVGGGLGTPVGLLGAGLGVMPLSWGNVDVGAGLSVDGLQTAAMASAHVPINDQAALGVSTGVSAGRYEKDLDGFFDEGTDERKVWEWAVWYNNGVQLRHAINETRMLRFEAGVGVPVGSDSPECNAGESECRRAQVPIVPYAGLTSEWLF